jgi:hypothetical protein
MIFILTMAGCFDSSIEIIPPEASIRVKDLEGHFKISSKSSGGRTANSESKSIDLLWNSERKSLFYEGMFNGTFRITRVMPLDLKRGIYLAQILDPRFGPEEIEHYKAIDNDPIEKEKLRKQEGQTLEQFNSMLHQFMVRKPDHQLILFRIDEKGSVWCGEEENWFKTIKGFLEALRSGDGKKSLQLLKENTNSLDIKFFDEKILER